MPGKPIAFLGAFHFCPGKNGKIPHVGGPTLATSSNVLVGGLPVAVKGDKLVCVGPPDTIKEGSGSVFANGKAVARLGDGTAHNGKIAVGNPTVLVGDKGGFSMVSPTAEHGSWNPVMNNAPPRHEMACGNVTYHTNDKGEISKVEGRVDELDQTPTPHPYREPGRLYGGMTLPCGGRDSTQSKVFKDPATEHKDNEAWRKPIVKNGTIQPLEGTKGKPKTMPRANEAGGPANRSLAGKQYIINKDKDGFPEFTIFETYIDDKHINNQDEKAHFQAANERLGKLLNEDPTLSTQLGLSKRQVKFLTATPAKTTSPPGLTWHHHQDVGKMQLASADLHGRFQHVGGMEIWGGGRP